MWGGLELECIICNLLTVPEKVWLIFASTRKNYTAIYEFPRNKHAEKIFKLIGRIEFAIPLE